MRSDSLAQLLSHDDVERVRRHLREGSERIAHWRRTRVGLRGMLLYLLGLPLLPAALVGLARGDVTTALGAATALGLIVAGARLNRRGLIERRVAPDRRFTRDNAFPFQHAAVVAVATGTALAAHTATAHGLAASLLFGLVAGIGMVLAYEVPGWRELRARRPQPIRDDAVRTALQEAEQRLLGIERAAIAIGNPELEQRLLRIVEEGHAVLAELAGRPDALHHARRFLHVHLEGAERVAGAYAKSHRILRGGMLEARFQGVLVQVEAAFRRQRRQLRENDLTDLDVQIEVLRKQLEREGIA